MMNTKRIFFKGLLTLCLGVAIVSSVRAFDPAPKKKLIELGWDIPTTDYIAKHWREMEANAPFAGIVYDLVGTSPDGKRYASQSLFTKEPWNREWFKSCVDDLNSCDFQRFHDNFIRINFYPAEFDWADDEAWNNICVKAGICAWTARETNGNICFDFESYGAELFRYDSASGRTFAESKALARRRGGEMCAAIVKEYPQVTILCLWMNSINLFAGRAQDPDSVLAGGAYGLLPSFIDGLLDSAAPETTLVDGCESGYYMNGASQYDRAACDMFTLTGPAVALVSPENRQKYRTQTQVGFGYYLDMYSNPEGSNYYRGPEPGETRFDRLAINLKAAMNASDEYVWIYGEQKRWWAPEGKSDDEWTSWEEALPGLTLLLDELNDPQGALIRAKDRVFSDPNRENLIVNGDFAKYASNGTPDSWNTWQIETRAIGKFTGEAGKATLTSMSSGCFIQSFAVEPGETYLVAASAQTQGNVNASIRVRWQDEHGNWTQESLDVLIAPLNGEEQANTSNGAEKKELLGRAVVPEGAKRLVVLLSASGGKTADDVVSYDSVETYRVK